MLLLACAVACQDGGSGDTPSPGPALVFELEDGPFEGVPVPERGEAFTLLANDADLDGDPDLLLNWHVFAPPALLWNKGGRFEPEARGWSLPECAAVPLLDADRKMMLRAIEARAEPGIYLWHSDWASFWFFALQGPFPEGAELWFECNRPIVKVQGRHAERYQHDGGRLGVPLGPVDSEHAYFVTQDAGLQVRVRVTGAPPRFHLGPELVRHEGELELWGRDPHGMAWLDAAGTARPELAVVRGALRGLLAPPLEAKRDDFYVAEGGTGYQRRELPRSFGRGRSAQWVDVDGDGRLELCVGNKSSPNALLAFDADFERAEDRAPDLGLDLMGADAFAWFDPDEDGDEDLLTLDARAGLGLLRSEAGRSFEPLDSAALGLTLGASDQADGEEREGETGSGGVRTIIDQHDLLLLDHDADGDLDVLVTGWGSAGACHLYRASSGRFTEASAEAGLAGLEGVTCVVVADFDADGWLDLFCLGKTWRLFHNRGGRFQSSPLELGERGAGAAVGTACDTDGDGRPDVVIAAESLVVAKNRTEPRGEWVSLVLTGPPGARVGALVRASYAGGETRLVRAGSFHRGHLSQSFGPIPFASPPANPLRRLEVRFPGGATVAREIEGPGSVTIGPPAR